MLEVRRARPRCCSSDRPIFSQPAFCAPAPFREGGKRENAVGIVAGSIAQAGMAIDVAPPRSDRWVAKETFASASTSQAGNAMRWPWWLKVAVVYAELVPLLAVGNLAGGDSGPLSGKLLAVGASVAVAGFILAGVRLRLAGRRRLGSGLNAVGVAPASVLIGFLWFPPVAVIGLLPADFPHGQGLRWAIPARGS